MWHFSFVAYIFILSILSHKNNKRIEKPTILRRCQIHADLNALCRSQ